MENSKNGLPDSANAPSKIDPLSQVMSRLGIREPQNVEVSRLYELLELLMEFAFALESPVFAAWKEVSGLASVRPIPLQKSLSRFTVGDPNIGKDEIARDLLKLRLLVAAFMASIPRAGKVAARHFANFAPAEIASMVKMEKKNGLLTSKEAANWRKFVELSSALNEEAIDAEIRMSITDYANQLLKGVSQPEKP